MKVLKMSQFYLVSVAVVLIGAAVTNPLNGQRPAESAVSPSAEGFLLKQAKATGGQSPVVSVLSFGSSKIVKSEMEEDLKVMSHLLQKKIRSSASSAGVRIESALGVNLHFAAGSAASKATYIEGFGALFEFSVPFPLVPAEGEDAIDRDVESKDSDWERARRELKGEGLPSTVQRWYHGKRLSNSRVESVGYVYDKDLVDALKSELVKAIRHASHIRGLSESDFIAISLTSSGGGLAPGQAFRLGHAYESAAVAWVQESDKKSGFGTVFTPGTTSGRIGIRIRKAVVTQFEAGEIEEAAFLDKAEVSVEPL